MKKAPDKTMRSTGYTLGRGHFAKICAVEGIHISPEMEKRFSDFDRDGLSGPERRQAISRDYAKKR